MRRGANGSRGEGSEETKGNKKDEAVAVEKMGGEMSTAKESNEALLAADGLQPN